MDVNMWKLQKHRTGSDFTLPINGYLKYLIKLQHTFNAILNHSGLSNSPKKKSTKIIDDITMLVSNVFPDGKSKMLPLGSKMVDYTRQIEDLENKLNAIKMETVELNA